LAAAAVDPFEDLWDPPCPDSEPGTLFFRTHTRQLRFLFVDAFDIDGDGVDELHANQVVFDDLANEPGLGRLDTPGLASAFWRPLTPYDIAAFCYRGDVLSPRTTAVATSDVTGDGRENLLVYSQFALYSGTFEMDFVRVFGQSQFDEVGFDLLTIAGVVGYDRRVPDVAPLLVPADADVDGPVLKVAEREHALVFTEPVVIAALAAAPCSDEISQELGACSTSFGQGTSTTADSELTVSVSVAVHAGVNTSANIPFVGEFGTSISQSVRSTASVSTGESYTVTTSRTFIAGPLEDAVVFTTVPYDRYTYTIVSHPEPELVGGTVEVSLPREPIVLKVSRDFYNDNVVGSNLRIGDNVFDHTVGDLSSYPSEARKNELLLSLGGLETGPLSVGQGTGSTELSIDVSEEVRAGGSLGIETELALEVTAGPLMAGFSVGYGADANLTIASGSQTTFGVSVGDIAPESFTEERFDFGLFTYVQEADGQTFDVVNFWVE
ncbi:MAG: hypothetical protein AAF211_14535, partial [Myxococcota bacterium]